MALALYYKEDDEFVAITTDTDLTSPLVTIHDGRNGDTHTTCLYLRNDDNTKWYSNIRITPDDWEQPNGYDDISYSETGWGVKLSPGANEPSSGEWEDIDWGDYVSMSNIGSDDAANTTTYYPVWYLITCPPNTDAKIKRDIVLDVSFTENSVA